jgi:hypothetical protein
MRIKAMARGTITPADAESCELRQLADGQMDREQLQTAMRFA